MAEVATTCIDEGAPCGWGGPNYPILEEAFRDLLLEHEPWIAGSQSSHTPWTIDYVTGGRLELWSLDSVIITRGRKYRKFIIDEAGLIGDLAARFDAEIDPTLTDFDGSLVAASTPNLVGPDFIRWFRLGQQEGTGWKSWTWSSIDNPAVREFALKRIDAQRRRGVPEWLIQQEWFAVPAEGQASFFRGETLARQKRIHGADPIRQGTLDFPALQYFERDRLILDGDFTRVRWTDDERGPWRLWCDRPNRERNYCIGADVAQGVGATNSVMSVGEAETGQKVARYSWPGATPSQFARLAIVAGHWFAGPDGPALICFERTGPGEEFAGVMREMNYPAVFREHQLPSKGISAGDKLGWGSTPGSREAMLGEYRAALETDRFRNPDEYAIDQCEGWQYLRGKLTNPHERTKAADDPSKVKHGDEVIADGLLWLAMQYAPRRALPDVVPPIGSLAARIAEREAKAAQQAEEWQEW